MLDRFGLVGLERRYPSQIAGGQQQRVALARTLAVQPRLLALDEPLSSLDEPTRARMRRELREILASFGVPVLLVTHDRMEAIALGDRVVVLVNGQVRQSGAVHEVFSRPSELAVAQVVGTDVVAPGEIVRSEGGLVTVVVGSVQLTAVEVPQIGRRVYVCIRAEEVVLQSRQEDGPSSARNRLPGVITSIQPEGPMLRVTLDCGFPLAALITRQSSDELHLQLGSPITAVLKAPAIHLIARR
jgi:molybdate transport system ATP-binding protein